MESVTVRTLHARNVVLGEAETLRVVPASISIEHGRIAEVVEGDASGSVELDLGNHLVAPASLAGRKQASGGSSEQIARCRTTR